MAARLRKELANTLPDAPSKSHRLKRELAEQQKVLLTVARHFIRSLELY
jgi:hypothetical protein